jgi:hypothetical protein
MHFAARIVDEPGASERSSGKTYEDWKIAGPLHLLDREKLPPLADFRSSRKRLSASLLELLLSLLYSRSRWPKATGRLLYLLHLLTPNFHRLFIPRV